VSLLQRCEAVIGRYCRGLWDSAALHELLSLSKKTIQWKLLLVTIAVAAAVVVEYSKMATNAAQQRNRSVSDATALVEDGQRWWRRSLDPTNPVGCATCHHDPAAVRGWAASFPKWRPLPPPHARVMTLLQANAEAVERHYRLADPRPVAIALTAFLIAEGEGTPITPGVSPDQPVFPERINALSASGSRGQTLFARRCAACHDAKPVASALLTFPRMRAHEPESFEGFIEYHSGPNAPISWNSVETADLVAFLMRGLSGQPLRLKSAWSKEALQ
jgi:mono/diheme cytochrome c family protein